MPIMLRERLKSPPPEVYSLHRKLSGNLINYSLMEIIFLFMKFINRFLFDEYEIEK